MTRAKLARAVVDLPLVLVIFVLTPGKGILPAHEADIEVTVRNPSRGIEGLVEHKLRAIHEQLLVIKLDLMGIRNGLLEIDDLLLAVDHLL